MNPKRLLFGSLLALFHLMGGGVCDLQVPLFSASQPVAKLGAKSSSDLHWTVKLDRDWEVGFSAIPQFSHSFRVIKVLGPFPIHAREQHFLSPAYPLDCEFQL